jgi:hypothetical protein
MGWSGGFRAEAVASVAHRGCDGWRDQRAFKIVSLGLAIAITRVLCGPAEIPIERMLIGGLLARGGDLPARYQL